MYYLAAWWGLAVAQPSECAAAGLPKTVGDKKNKKAGGVFTQRAAKRETMKSLKPWLHQSGEMKKKALK